MEAQIKKAIDENPYDQFSPTVVANRVATDLLPVANTKVSDMHTAPNKGHFVQNVLGPVVQSIVSLTSSLVIKILTVLLSTISNSQVFF